MVRNDGWPNGTIPKRFVRSLLSLLMCVSIVLAQLSDGQQCEAGEREHHRGRLGDSF